MTNYPTDAGIGRRITRYGAILTASGILCKLLLLVYTVLAVEILGKEQFGRIEYFIEMAIIFSILVDFGLEQTVTREIARRRDQLQHILYPLVSFRLAASFAGGVVMIFFLWTVAKPGHTLSLILCATFYFFVVLNMMLIRAVIRSFELMAYEGLANVLDKIVHIGAAIFLLFYYPRLPAIMMSYVAGAAASLFIYWFVILYRFGCTCKSYSINEWVDWQKLAVPIGLSAACILLLHREDTAMVNWIRGDEETGLYRAPYRFLEGLFLFPQVLAISAYPIFSKLYHELKPFSGTATTLLRGLMMISLPIAAGGTCIADQMILSLTPELGPDGGMVFKILLWSLPFIYANFLLGTLLNATDRQHKNLRASFCGLISNAVLNMPAIYIWGAFGASVVTVLSQGLYCILMLVYTRDFNLMTDGKRYLAIVVSCSVMVLILIYLQLNWLLEIPIGALIFLIVLITFRGISREDLSNMRKAIGK